jgi:hypothetical protein
MLPTEAGDNNQCQATKREVMTHLGDASKEGNDAHERCRRKTFVCANAQLLPCPMDWGYTISVVSHRRHRILLPS